MRSRAYLAICLFAGTASVGATACGDDGGTHDHVDASHGHVDARPDSRAIDAPADIDAPPLSEGSALQISAVADGIAYAAPIQIGDDPTTYHLDIDTGSTIMAVAASTCSNCGTTPEYTPGTGAVDQHQPSSSTYEDGTGWSGENYADSVKIVGDSDVPMRFAAMTSQNSFLFSPTEEQGIIGFAGPELAFDNTDSYIAKRGGAGLPSSFAFEFCPDRGRLWFGGPDPSFEQSAPQFTPLVPISSQQPFYEFSIQSTKVGTTSIPLTGASIADSGTSLIVVSQQVSDAVQTAVQGSTGWSQIFPGQTLSTQSCLDPGSHTRDEIDAALPPFQITLPKVGGGTFTLSSPASQSYLFDDQGCYFYALEVIGDTSIPPIIGVAWLHQFVSVFDRANSRIGFAPENGCVLPQLHHEAIVPHAAPHWRHGHRPRL